MISNAPRLLLLLSLSILLLSGPGGITLAKECTELLAANLGDEALLRAIQEEGLDEKRFVLICLDNIVRQNYFNSARHVVGKIYGKQTAKNKKQVEDAESIVLSAIQDVRDGQDEVMELFEQMQLQNF